MSITNAINHQHEHKMLRVSNTKETLGLGSGNAANTIAIIGNSIAVQDTPFSPSQVLVTSCFQWANYLLNQRFEVVHSSSDLFAGYLGVSSDTSAQILARIGSVITLAPKYCLMLGIVENDNENDVATATTQSNITEMLNILQNAGIVPILCTGIPSALTSTVAEANIYYSNNAFIRNASMTRSGLIVVDISHEFVDYAQTYPQPLSTHVSSGPHPNALGAYFVGKKLYKILDPLIPVRPIFGNHYLSVANGGDTPDSAIANPLFQGTAGTAVAPAAGTVADGWTCNALGATSGTASKVARTDLPLLEWQQVAYVGDATYTYGSDAVRVYSAQVTIPNCDLAVGDNIQAFAEFEVDGSDTAFLGAEILVRCVNGSTEYYNGFTRNSSLATPLGEDYPAGVMASPKFTIPTGTTTLQIHLKAHASAVNAAFTARFGRVIIKKL